MLEGLVEVVKVINRYKQTFLIFQDQVTKAEEQERLVLSQEDLENARLAGRHLTLHLL